MLFSPPPPCVYTFALTDHVGEIGLIKTLTAGMLLISSETVIENRFSLLVIGYLKLHSTF